MNRINCLESTTRIFPGAYFVWISLVCCGVTCEPLTDYWPWATRRTSLSKLRWDVGPRLKCWMTALSTWGCVLASPWARASISNFLATFWCRKLSRYISSGVIGWTCPGLAAMTVKERGKTSKGHMTSPGGGGGMLGNFQQNSRILILYIYSLSNVYNN